MAATMRPLATVHVRSPCSPCAHLAPFLSIKTLQRSSQVQQKAATSLSRCERQQRHLVLQASATLEDSPTQLDVSKMEPLGDRIIIKPDEEKNVTEGGLMLTSGATKTISDAVIGKVLAKGEDVDIAVNVGDTVIFQKYSSSDVKVPDGDIIFVAQKSVLAVLS